MPYWLEEVVIRKAWLKSGSHFSWVPPQPREVEVVVPSLALSWAA